MNYNFQEASEDLVLKRGEQSVRVMDSLLNGGSQGGGGMVEITYSELKALRDNSQLKPGQWYRIIDYTTTTVQTNTQSAGHVFDVIVRADSANILNENAFAALHSGDTYFANSKINSWELKYCIDNDTNRFAWADSTNGKGVIYYMKDEWNNEGHYDFKNIMFKRYKITGCVKSPDLVGQYAAEGANDVELDDTANWCFTFCILDFNDNQAHDVSTEQERYPSDEGYAYKTKNNKIGFRFEGDYENEPIVEKMFLPDNVFVTNTDLINAEFEDGEVTYSEFYGFYYNTSGDRCYSNTFGNSCQYNTFGNNCYSNTFGNDCNNNTFGKDCYNNTFGNNCNFNTFGYGCTYNTFRNECSNNTFSFNCYRNTFGNYCHFNTFGNTCYFNTFGDNCLSNTFGKDCNNNTFGNECNSNTFGKDCRYNTFGIKCSSNTFGNNCQYIKFGTSSTTNGYCQYIIVENGNQHIYLDCSATTSSSSYFQNVKIAQGVNNTNTYKTITHTTAGDTFQTIYKPINSKEISV